MKGKENNPDNVLCIGLNANRNFFCSWHAKLF